MQLSPDIIAAVRESDFVKSIHAGTVVIDNSTFSNWDACEVKGLFAGALKLEPAKSRTPLAFGAAVHAGLEALLTGFSIHEAVRIAQECAIKEGLRECQDDRRSMEKLETLLEAYSIDYKLRADKFEPVMVEDNPLIEQSFCFPLGKINGVELMWSGKIDLISWWGPSNEIWVVDHKTTSVMGAQFTATMERSSQFLGYMWAARHLTEALGKKVSGVIVNAIALRAKGYEFRVEQLPFADYAIDEWQNETVLKFGQLIQRVMHIVEDQAPALPTRESCCTKYGKCPFFTVCNTHPKVMPAMLKNREEFKVSDWSPLK